MCPPKIFKKKKKKKKKTGFFKSFLRTHVLFWGHWYPCFGFLVTSPLGFKAKLGSTLFAFCGGECNVHPPRSSSGATRMQPVTSPHACACKKTINLTNRLQQFAITTILLLFL